MYIPYGEVTAVCLLLNKLINNNGEEGRSLQELNIPISSHHLSFVLYLCPFIIYCIMVRIDYSRNETGDDKINENEENNIKIVEKD